MTERMLKFVSRDRNTPAKRSSADRRADFGEIYARYSQARAAEQAARCSQCGVPFCANHCPLGNDIPDWLKLVAEGRFEEAYRASAATNTFPEICGRICPQDRLCEGACVIEQSGHGTVTIGAVEQFITETAFENGWVAPIQPLVERPESVGVIGAGPAGLAAAEELRVHGLQVSVYDRYDRAGGLLVYGIPNFKLDKAVVKRRVERLERASVKFVLNCEVGRHITLAALRERHDAVLIASGVYRARALECPGAGAENVVEALDYLTASNRRGFGELQSVGGVLDANGKNVVVVGGGDTAMDCVRTAIRQGATSVRCLYRRDRANMPGSQREVANAEEEGVIFDWLSAPASVSSCRINVRAMRLGAADASGRSSPEECPGPGRDLSADLVIKALGFEAERLTETFGAGAPEVTKRGTVRVDRGSLETSLKGVFAAGDIVRGASLVVWAIKDGRDAARGIIRSIDARVGAQKFATVESK